MKNLKDDERRRCGTNHFPQDQPVPALRASGIMDLAAHALTDVVINYRSFGPGPRHFRPHSYYSNFIVLRQSEESQALTLSVREPKEKDVGEQSESRPSASPSKVTQLCSLLSCPMASSLIAGASSSPIAVCRRIRITTNSLECGGPAPLWSRLAQSQIVIHQDLRGGQSSFVT